MNYYFVFTNLFLLDYKPLKGSKIILPIFLCPVLTHSRHSINELKRRQSQRYFGKKQKYSK